jgi:hypothetical protein
MEVSMLIALGSLVALLEAGRRCLDGVRVDDVPVVRRAALMSE